ncbi:MAG: hypothetical protein AAF108_09050 [Planctomycetota bacterium]
MKGLAAGGLAVVLLGACGGGPPTPDFGRLYNAAASGIGDDRTPVIVIPGILGSKLEDMDSSRPVWGSFTYGAVDADTPEGAAAVALPMRENVPLSELTDEVRPTGVLDSVTADIGFVRNLKIGAYADILFTLAAGDYADEDIIENAGIDYGGHYTCYQLAYDWRRDVSESAALLHQRVLDAQAAIRSATGLSGDEPVKVDVVAHSMGGLLLRYYLRYGPQPLPEDGSLPELTWEGARHVERAVLIATPNAGSVESTVQLVEGLNLNPLFPNYRPGVLGTMPSIYQLMSRPRHARVVDQRGEPIDLYDSAVWERYGWGLAAADQDRVLGWLLPGFDDPAARRRIALDHLRKCLAKARQFHAALDVPASPPEGLELFLFAGDAIDTPVVVTVDDRGRPSVTELGPGDKTVPRTSTLMDERVGGGYAPYLRSPIDWTQIFFLHASHLGLTRDPAFVDNLLYLLLEKPRGGATAPELIGEARR